MIIQLSRARLRETWSKVVRRRCEERIRHGYIKSKGSGSFMMYIPWR